MICEWNTPTLSHYSLKNLTFTQTHWQGCENSWELMRVIVIANSQKNLSFQWIWLNGSEKSDFFFFCLQI